MNISQERQSPAKGALADAEVDGDFDDLIVNRITSFGERRDSDN